MKNYFLLFTLLSCATQLSAQVAVDFQHYKGLKCAGLIPEDFTKPSQQKYNEALAQEVKDSDNRKVAQTKDDFLLETNYLIDGLLQSGIILFGDTVTQYLNRVADNVLVNEPELRGQLRFYCVRSTEANAFSTNQGIIFVTLGLIAQLENEAQLAFILAHEIAHYERRHSINAYLQNEMIFDKKSRYDSHNDRIRLASDYSKERELEADSIAIARIAKTTYNCDQGVEALFVTQFSALPFEDFEFKATALQRPMMEFPKNLFLDSVTPIDLERDKDDDTYSSHPNMATRRNALEVILEKTNSSNTARFIESEKSFYTIRRIARYETIRLQLQEREYCVAYYNSYVLLKEDSSNIYLKTCMGKALYGLAKYKNHDNYNTTKYLRKEGNQQQCYYMFGKLKAPQLNLIALRYLYDLAEIDSSFAIISMRNDLAEEAIRMNGIHYKDLVSATAIYKESLNKKDTAKAETDNKPAPQPEQNPGSKAYVSKYDKLRQEKKKQESLQFQATETGLSKFYLLAFSDILDQPKVKAMFSAAEITAAAQTANDEKMKLQEQQDDLLGDDAYKRLENKRDYEVISKKLGVDTVVFVDPFYMELDDYNYPVFVESENAERELPELLLKSATSSKLSAAVLCPKAFKEGDVNAYNDLAAINAWTNERSSHEDFDFICLSTDQVMPLTIKYNTTHFCYTSIFSYDHITYYYVLMYDVTTGSEKINYNDKRVQKARASLLFSLHHFTMNKIKATRKQAP